MANHAYVYTKRELTYGDVLSELESINQRCLGGLFTVNINDDKNFITIWCEKYFGTYEMQQIWISDEREYGYYENSENQETYIEYDEPKIICKNSIIEFRHGHRTSVGWTIESIFREEIAKRYDALVGDDGYIGRHPTKPIEDIKKDLEESPFWKYVKNEKRFKKELTLEQSVDEMIKEIEQINRERKLKRLI